MRTVWLRQPAPHAWTDCGPTMRPRLVPKLSSTTAQFNDTALRAIGGGQQRFVKFMRVLIAETEPRHLSAALFQVWQREDDGPSLRWDPATTEVTRFVGMSRAAIRFVLSGGESSGNEAHAVAAHDDECAPSPNNRVSRSGAKPTFWTWPDLVPAGRAGHRAIHADFAENYYD